MRYVSAFCLFALFSCPIVVAQVLPTSNGTCRVTASGLESCDWMSGVPRLSTTTTADSVEDLPAALFVTRYLLGPGAPLDSRGIVGGEVLIVGRSNGEVVNEKKSPPAHINIFENLVMVMPKNEPYLLRNIGKGRLDLLLIEIRKDTPKPDVACQGR
jgi:hypothetical protein